MSDNEENINNTLEIATSIVDNIVNGELSDAQNSIKDILGQNISGEIDDHKQEFAAGLFRDDMTMDSEIDESELVTTKD
jgi:hypothetical protein